MEGLSTVEHDALPSPYDDPEIYDLLFESLDFDLAFWTQVGREAGGPVLDVGCGTGRVTLPLLAAGVDVDGIDLSAPMLERLRDRAAERGFAPRVAQASMQDFTMPRRYTRAICAFNVFAHHDRTEDQIRTLTAIREHLAPGGALVLHLSYPSFSMWNDPDGEPVLELRRTQPGGDTLELWDTRIKDRVGQCQRSIVEVRLLDPEGAIVDQWRSETTQRWVFRFELELLLRHAGYSRWQIFGGFAGEPLEHDDQQMIAWAWRD